VKATHVASMVLCASLSTATIGFAEESGETRKPRVLQHEPAEYPTEARNRGLEADVELELEIDREGAVTSVRVVTARGHGFDEAAELAARKLRFEPALRNGKPAKARIRYRYAFVLEKPSPVADVAPTTGALAGRLRIAGSDAPLAGATVSVVGPDGSTRRTESGPDGR
jgi:TonB family protein